MRKRDYYEVLGLRAEATVEEVRRAYRHLARQCSPDVNLWDRTAADLFKEIEEAYRVLRDPATRSLYDRYGHQAFQVPRPESRPQPRRGEDLHYTIDLGFEEAVRGFSATLEVTRREACAICRARGTRGASPAPCPECEGRGERWEWQGRMRTVAVCPTCLGLGTVVRDPCPACQGRGIAPRQVTIAVDIPPGVDTGSQIRVPGEGHAGPFGGPPGDLLVITRVRPHPLFTRKADNLYYEVPVTIPEAVLGARIQVPTPDGPAAMIVPPGTQSGQLFRIRGKGCPRLGRDGRGDLYVAVRVVIPRNLDSRIEELLRALERLLPDNPRKGPLEGVGTRP